MVSASKESNLIGITLALLLLSLQATMTSAFIIGIPTKSTQLPPSPLLFSSPDDDSSSSDDIFINLFPGAEILTLELREHKPMGCTVDESLLDDGRTPLLVTKVTPRGHAANAGLQIGDVLLAATNIFGGDQMENLLGADLEQLKKLVASRPEKEPLLLRVARGTSVLEQHESAVVDLCTTQSQTDKELEDCMVTFLNSGFDDEAETANMDNDEPPMTAMESLCQDEDVECVLGEMQDLWMEGMPMPEMMVKEETKEEETKEEPLKPKEKPWRSRSSPSGTYVRDPKTGKMMNID